MTNPMAHHERDVAGMWTTFRSGGAPFAVPQDGRRRVALPVGSTASPLGGAEVALQALHQELTGRHVDACTTLGRLAAEDADDAVEALVEAGAASLERLHDRARYPVSTELLVKHVPDHLGTMDGDTFSRWWEMVEVIAFRAAGLRLAPQAPELDDHHRTRLCAAFHAAAVILRFTARRHWRRPVELLGDLADAR